MINFEQPELLGLMIPVLIAGIYLLRTGTKKGLIISRIIVAALLVTALASPFTLVPKVTSDDTPDIVLISDNTASMGLFKEETANNLYEAMTARTPTTLVQLTGDSTSLGDAIMQYSRGDNQIVIVTDGNNNHGAELEDALQFAKDTGTTVYAVEPELEFNDLSVQILGDKTVVVDTELSFEILVSKATDEPMSYQYDVYIDGKPEKTGIKRTQIDRQKTSPLLSEPIVFSQKEMGSHIIKVVVKPSSFDMDSINNVFYKTVYVIQQPTVLLITNDKKSDFAQKLDSIYDLRIENKLSDIEDISKQKVVVIDNIHEFTLSEDDVEKLEDYISSGRGLYVVGGERAFNKGNYLDSSFEKLLPIISKPTESTGGKYVVLILDLSGSTLTGGEGTERIGDVIRSSRTYPLIIQSAKNIISSEEFEDATLGIIGMGNYEGDLPEEMLELIVPQNINDFNESLDSIQLYDNPMSETNLDKGLSDAQQLIESKIEDDTAAKSIIIIADGSAGINPANDNAFDEAFNTAKSLIDSGFYLTFIHIESNATGQVNNGEVLAEKFMDDLGGLPLAKYISPVDLVAGVNDNNQQVEPNEEEPDEQEIDDEETGIFEVLEYNQNHFITRNLNISGNITGYNQVTPKIGSDRILITNTGKNILTTWRYGLGRVAVLATDNGKSNGWSNDLFVNNPKLTSSAINWAIGNPREETGFIVEAPDTWYGTPAQLELTLYDEDIPNLKYDGKDITTSFIGKNVYEATVDSGLIGIHDFSGYPVAVNYAIEYRDVGFNEELPSLIKKYGGETYTENEARARLFEEARQNSQKLIRETVSQKIYFLLAALILFLGEVIVRRWKEIQEMKKLQSEIQE
ncbi:hypothetical protein V7O66_05300 [Methanolobus sp. ZRKC3]|uniref:DUF7408 domain-containing protein n=1 Tax=Methanolobus sp. ZRKC3 TaxID=3125786 RepID=UPI0032509EE6